MPITISNLTVAQSTPAGTIVGVLTAGDASSIMPCNFILSKQASGYFAVSSNNLITVWSGSIAPGYYPVRVRAVGINEQLSGSATFIINVIDPPSPSTPTGITFVTTTASLPDNSPAGTTVATFSVSMSDGSSFAGTLAASPAVTVAISGSMQLVLARALTSADDGSQQWGVKATQNGVTVSSSIAVQVIPLSPPPPPPPAPAPAPPPPVSPDGSAISGGTGSLQTTAGAWTFGPASTAFPGNWIILLNGQQAAGGIGSELEVDNGGQMYAIGTDGHWYVWQSNTWVLTTNPNPPPPPPPAAAIDSVITLVSAADVVSRRQSLIQNAWNAPNLPTTQSMVTSNITNPFPSFTNIARVDQYAASMTNGQSNTSNLYIAGPTCKNRLVILNPGHQDTCDWTAFATGYRIQPVLQALLNAGFDVFAMNMPNCGSATAHASLFNNYGDLAMQYFIEPIVQALNYMDGNASYLNYNMTGLSGGGWTTAVAAALDTRIQISVAVAGSMPGVQFIVGAGSSPNHGDCASPCFAEQNNVNFYEIAGFLDLYIMAACGTNRQHVQILNNDDDCCFGNLQWTDVSFNFQNYYDVSWLTYINNYAAAIANSATTVTPMNFNLMVDYVATQHQISTWAQSEILTILG